MREFCLVSRAGTVINMCMKYDATPPELNVYQEEMGLSWVPVNKVNVERLRAYRYWNERP